jgi:hypothetical protein
MRFCDIWKEQCDAARQIEAEFGTEKALDYLIGEKFLNFLEAAETCTNLTAQVRYEGPSSQRSPTPVWFAVYGASLRLTAETGLRKIRGSVTNENNAKVAVQITMMIPAMISRVWTTAFGPPAKTRTGNEVRTITKLRSADLRTIFRRLGVGDSSCVPATIDGFADVRFMAAPWLRRKTSIAACGSIEHPPLSHN